MKILRLHIENFGRLKDLDMEFQEGLHIVRGENGWGKSTLAAFIKAMFYGLPGTTKRSLKENERKRYQPWQGGAFGGSLEFAAGGQTYRVERFFGAKEKEDTYELYDLRTGLISLDYSERLGEELFGVDRKAYERSSFLGQQDLAVSINDSLSARLTQAEEEAGDMRNYEQALSSLEDQMKYYLKTGGRGLIGKLEEERRGVREELTQCVWNEDDIEELTFELESRRKDEADAKIRVEEAGKKLQTVQSYAQIGAKKAQYELLKKQAEEKQKELQQIAAALGAYSGPVPKEEDLDRCRERIYQLDGLRQKEEGAKRQVHEAVSRQGDVEDAKGALSSAGPLCWILAVLLLAAGVFLLFRGNFIGGIVCLAGGALLLLLGFQKDHNCRTRQEQLEQQLQESSRSVREAEHTLRDLQKKQDVLEKKIDDFLGVPKGTKPEELDRLWKQERQRSREYRELKEKYEMCRLEVSKSRTLGVQYMESLSEEEQMLLQAPAGAQPEKRLLKERLEKEQTHLERLRKEQEELRYRLKGLQEKAEQIPELQEREAELSERIAEAAQEHGLLEQTVRYLKKAREQFSVHYLRELKERLEYYLAELEPDRKVETALDVSLQMKVQELGAYRSLETQSAGQQELLYFAERLAVLDVLYKEEQPLLILDDPFTNLDPGRQKRAMELLQHISQKRQMVYLTCHEG